MTARVQSLLDYHEVTNFGSQANLLFQQEQARSTYLALTKEEQEDLARRAITEIAKGNRRLENALYCLACFQPGCLNHFHNILLENRILWPGEIFFGAGSDVAKEMIALCDKYCLTALAWIGGDTVQKFFSNCRTQLPSWCGELRPHQFAEHAGWELTDQGGRRNLFTETAHPLLSPNIASNVDQTVKIGLTAKENCGWCNRTMVNLIEFAHIESMIPDQGIGPVRVVTCQICTCYGGPLFIKNGQNDEAIWHECNRMPSYLPPASEEWGAFPTAVMSTDTRHFLQAANWSMVPGVSFSQVGGLPTWIQGPEFPSCPDCSQKMPFIGQISNADFMQYGEGIYYAFRCPHCDVTATFYQQT